MTIKQQGGIFGRNPTFNDVTVDGTLTSSSISLSALDNVPIGSTTASTGDFTDLTVTQEIELQMSANAFGATTSSGYILRTGSGGSAPFTQAGALVYQPRISTTDGRSNHKFYTGSPLALALDLKPDQNAHFGGNAVFASGNGIDFSATAGTGTSELFDDYEEGTWVPTLTTDGTDFDSVTYDSVTYGWYTKVGNVVAVGGRLRTDAVTVGAGSGNLVIGGLPFSVVKTGAISIGRATSFVTKYPKRAEVSQGTSYIALFGLTAVNTGTTSLDQTNVGTGANANYISFSGVYQV